MHYQRSYRHALHGPDWQANLLYCTGCVLVPFVGWCVLLGYAIEGLEQRGRDPEVVPARFDPERWRPYLMRGLWPLLVQALAVMPALVLATICVLAVLVLRGDRSSTISLPLLATLLAAALVLLALLLTMVLLPLTIYTGLGGAGSVAAAGRFTRSFMGTVGARVFLAQVFLISTGLALAIVGTLPCGMGLPPALALVTLAQYHLMAQLYVDYLHRGGAAVAAFTEDPAGALPTVPA